MSLRVENRERSRERTLESLDEQVTILRDLQSPYRGSQNLHTEPFQNTHFVKSDADVQRALTTKGEQDAIRAFLLEYVCDIIRSDGEEVDLGRELVRGLPRRDVGVNEDGVDALLAEGLQGLRTGVVELASLTNAEASATDEDDFAGVARLGWGACTGAVERMMGPCGAWLALDDDGTGWGYCDGAAGLGRRPELFVNGWVASGSKEERTELDMAVVRVRVVVCGV